jgi:hypothetical protein
MFKALCRPALFSLVIDTSPHPAEGQGAVEFRDGAQAL